VLCLPFASCCHILLRFLLATIDMLCGTGCPAPAAGALELKLDFALPSEFALAAPSMYKLGGGEPSAPGAGHSSQSSFVSSSGQSAYASSSAAGGGGVGRRLFADFGTLAALPDSQVQEQRRQVLLWMLAVGGRLPILESGGSVTVVYRLNRHATWLPPIASCAPNGTWQSRTVQLPGGGGDA